MEFKVLKTAVQQQFSRMQVGGLFTTETDRDEIWNHYLSSFPEGSNPMFRERTEHDCSCCKSFIRQSGNVVSVSDGKLVSIWDIEIGGYYQVVADKMSEYVKSCAVNNVFRSDGEKIGTDFNLENIDGSAQRWNHFYIELPKQFVMRKESIGGFLSEARSNYDVFLRTLEEITTDAADTAIELIDQGSLYRGDEHLPTIELFIACKEGFDQQEAKELYCWKESARLGQAARIRNTVIGTFLLDLSNDVDINDAAESFGRKMDGYKVPKNLIYTKRQTDKARNDFVSLGLEGSLERRYAVSKDLIINNVLFADRSVKSEMNVFEQLAEEVPEKVDNFDHVESVTVEKFITDILPKAETIELMLENRHEKNMMSLLAPVNENPPNLFKWGNMFSWGYNGGVADSMRERVKKAGGRVDGVIRFTHSWNHDGKNQSLMDLHVFLPTHESKEAPLNGREIHNNYGNANRVGWNKRTHLATKGSQDVDYTREPGNMVPIENISFQSLNKLPEGEYIFKIHNWRSRLPNSSGFIAEIELDGDLSHYEYKSSVADKEWITVATAVLSGGKFEITHRIPHNTEVKEFWGLSTNRFHKAKMIMHSPNHWDGERTGNKHHFFILEDCFNPGSARGFYNEFLREDLREHRKVFEILGGKMKAESSDDQLSGVGFSSTQRNEVLCRVSGKFKRVVKVIF